MLIHTMGLFLYIVAFVLLYILWQFKSLFFKSVLNPFHEDSRKTIREQVTDQKKRDEVLKNGFKPEKVPKDLDAIVIGSGIGGLSVAAILSKVGKKVLVLEQHDQAGGCCHTFIDKGYEFDVGIHYIGDMHTQSLSRTLLDQISDGQIQWEYLNKNKNEMKRFPIYANAERQKSHLKKLFPDEDVAIDKFYEKVVESSFAYQSAMIFKFLPLWLINIIDKLGFVSYLTNFFKLNEQTLKDVVDELTENQELRDVFSYCFGDYGTIPSKVGFPLQALLFHHFSEGASYPVGGASEIAHSIIPVIERGGGEVLVRAEVIKILADSNNVVNGVTVRHGKNETDVLAPLIISDAGVFNTFLKLLPPSISSQSRFKKFYKKERALTCISLFVGLDASAEELEIPAKRNLWIFPKKDIDKVCVEYAKNTREQIEEEDIPLMFVSFPSTKDPTWEKRFPGKTTMAIVTFTNYDWFEKWENKPCQRRGDDYEALKKTLGWKLIDQVIELYPKVKDHIDYVNVGSPLSNNFYIGSNKGEIYGLDHDKERFSLHNFSELRPKTDIPGKVYKRL
ncbi:putative all-trans-retinol 13,14-reductase [Armadillidium vulgare]|nr:putative all-trans-retinol 13,14-reductase [Armadillidium vulgare]